MSLNNVRRIAAPLLIGGTLVAGVAFAAQPAMAGALTNCSAVEVGFEYAGGYVVGEKFRICSDGTERPNPVTIQRQNPATLAWTTVATGSGVASYKCQGSATRRFRMGTTGTGIAFPCT